jgi:hypothetical protein
MFISVIHRISDPDAFAPATASAGPSIPEDLKLQQYVASGDRSTSICLWEAPSVERVRDLVEPLLGRVSKNEYIVVDASGSMGLPANVSTSA